MDEIDRVVKDEADRAALTIKVVNRGQINVAFYNQRRSRINLVTGSTLN